MTSWLKSEVLSSSKWGYFSWGFVGAYGIHVIPFQYCVDGRNRRVVNWATVPRAWYYAISENPESITQKKIRWLVSNTNLYTVCNQKFWEVNTETWSWTEKSTTDFSNDVETNVVTYGKYTICLTWDDYPFVYDRVADTRTKLTSSNIEAWSVPRFWTRFAYWTYVVWWWNKKNVLYISRGVTTANPEYAYDWVWTWSEKLELPSNIEWIASNKEYLFLFLEDEVRFLTTQSLASVGSFTNTYTTPLAWENRPASQRSIVVADNFVFFLTKNNEIASVNYTPWVTADPVSVISNKWDQNIQRLLRKLDSDQSNSFGYFHKEKWLVKWHVRTKWEPINNIVIVYDVVNKQFYIDNNKYFGCWVKHNWNYYCGNDSVAFIYIDETGKDDDGWPIKWYREWWYWSPWDKSMRTEYREVGIWWQIDETTTITLKVKVDGFTEKTEDISWEDVLATGQWSYSHWEYAYGQTPSIDVVRPFEKVISPWNLRARGKLINARVERNGKWLDFALSWLWVWYIPLNDTDKADKL